MIELTRTGPSINKGKSRQDYATPENFRRAIIRRFGMPAWDLAASGENHFSPRDLYFDEATNSLVQDWSQLKGVLFLNPPFGNIEPWAKKCVEENTKGAEIIFLVPASTGAFWFQTHIHQKARVLFLAPRLSFDGKAPFPKDCILAHYSSPSIGCGYECWRWDRP